MALRGFGCPYVHVDFRGNRQIPRRWFLLRDIEDRLFPQGDTAQAAGNQHILVRIWRTGMTETKSHWSLDGFLKLLDMLVYRVAPLVVHVSITILYAQLLHYEKEQVCQNYQVSTRIRACYHDPRIEFLVGWWSQSAATHKELFQTLGLVKRAWSLSCLWDWDISLPLF
jgi:hypothetical protein